MRERESEMERQTDRQTDRPKVCVCGVCVCVRVCVSVGLKPHWSQGPYSLGDDFTHFTNET